MAGDEGEDEWEGEGCLGGMTGEREREKKEREREQVHTRE